MGGGTNRLLLPAPHRAFYSLRSQHDFISLLGGGGPEDRTSTAEFKKPNTNWFDPDKPAQADRQTDWLIEIYRWSLRRWRFSNASDGPTIFGDLRNEGTKFVSWYPLRQRPQFNNPTKKIVKTLPYHRFVDFVADWENPLKFPKEHRHLGYKHEKHDPDQDPLRLAADAVAHSPVFTTSINVSLAIRKSLRRYLDLEPLLPDFEGESS